MSYLDEAQTLHQELTVVDAHHDIPMDVLHRHKLGQPGVLSREWAGHLTNGGVNVQVLPVFIEDRYLPSLGLREILRMTEAVIHDLEHDDSNMALATSMAEVERINADGKIAAILALEGCDGLGGDPALLRALYRLGVRMVAFTWDRRNPFADGTAVRNPGGLTDAGIAAVNEMFERHIIFDVSHLAEPGFWDAIDIVQGPIIASHSNARAVCDHRRNLTDDQLRAIAETGGVIGLNFYGSFVDDTEPTLARMADHFEHIVKVAGIDHVGLGPDFVEGSLRELARTAFLESPHDPAIIDIWIPDCQDIDTLPRFTAALLERGYGRDELAKLLGQNFLRVFREVWGH
jgi:membrane dipeptidase